MKNIAKDISISALGCIIAAFGTSSFLLPNMLSTGGFSGIATILYYFFELNIGTTTIILNIPLFILIKTLRLVNRKDGRGGSGNNLREATERPCRAAAEIFAQTPAAAEHSARMFAPACKYPCQILRPPHTM